MIEELNSDNFENFVKEGSCVIDFYADVANGYFLDSLSESLPLVWGVTSSDGIAIYGNIIQYNEESNTNGFYLDIDISDYYYEIP